jgi:hypothetical protein
MTTNKKKAAAGVGTRAASKNPSGRDHTTKSRIKVAIVRLALRGLLPAKLAEWLIKGGGLCNA